MRIWKVTFGANSDQTRRSDLERLVLFNQIAIERIKVEDSNGDIKQLVRFVVIFTE